MVLDDGLDPVVTPNITVQRLTDKFLIILNIDHNVFLQLWTRFSGLLLKKKVFKIPYNSYNRFTDNAKFTISRNIKLNVKWKRFLNNFPMYIMHFFEKKFLK